MNIKLILKTIIKIVTILPVIQEGINSIIRAYNTEKYIK